MKMRMLKVAMVIAFVLGVSVFTGLKVASAQGVLPQGGDLPPVDSPQAFLGWLALGGAPLIGALTSLLQRKAKWFQDLSSDGKWWVSFGLGAGLPALAGLLLLYIPASFWEAITPAFYVIGSAIIGYIGKEIVYLRYVRPNEPREPVGLFLGLGDYEDEEQDVAA